MRAEQPERRDLILKAVMDLLTTRGPEGWTLKEVAKKAKVSTSLIGYHYGNKSRLFKAALDWILEQVAEVEASLAADRDSPKDRLASFFLLQEKLLVERTELLTGWFFFVTLGRTEPWVAARVQENYVERVEAVRDFFEGDDGQGPHPPGYEAFPDRRGPGGLGRGDGPFVVEPGRSQGHRRSPPPGGAALAEDPGVETELNPDPQGPGNRPPITWN